MSETLHQGGSLAWDYLWQSTLFLTLGLGASVALARWPARAHRALLLAMLAALCSPPLTQVVRHAGWGLFTPRSPENIVAATSSIGTRAIPSPVAQTSPRTGAPAPGTGESAPSMPAALPHSFPGSDAPARSITLVSVPQTQPNRMPWQTLAIGIWLLLLALVAFRFVMGVALGVIVVRRARVLTDEKLAAAAAASSDRLGVRPSPELRTSPLIRCPSIWCWGSRPVILLQEDAETGASVDWVGVFCHELAHWVRRDHWSSLLAEVLACALPWHPLAWCVRHRLGQLSELACDDWALSTGLPSTDYAESLLCLIPQRPRAIALAAVSSRSGLVGRLRHILDDRRTSPAVGGHWAWLSAVATVLAASAIALAQSRKPNSKEDGPAPNTQTQATRTDSAPSKETAMKRTLSGTVLGPDGKPVAGATVFWVATRIPPLAFVALPKDRDSSPAGGTEIMPRSQTGADGAFSLSADFDPKRYERDITLVARATGLGILSQSIKPDDATVTLRMPAEVVIHGRLLTPGGSPAQGVRVTLNGFYNDQQPGGMYVGLHPPEKEVPPYWPTPPATDADGKFTLEGVPEGYFATLTFWHPDYAVDDVVVNTTATDALTPGLKAGEITPVKPTFTHTLEPARPVQGRVTDKQTGKPLAGLFVEMIPMRRHGGMPFTGRTDAGGRYRISGHGGARFFITTVFPRADSGYLAARDTQFEWPAGAKFLEKNFALEKGLMLHGQVIDAGTKQPIPGAAVVYQPSRGNPNNRDYDLRNPVLTGSDGRFSITALPGEGFLAVETPDENFVRVPTDDHGQSRTLYPQGLAQVDLAAGAEPKPVEIAVRKGITLEARAIGPDGKVVEGLIGCCEGIDAKLIDVWNQGALFQDGVFRLPGADPARTYRVYLLNPKRKIGAVVDLKPDPALKQPFEVKLQPTARVHGTVKATSGSPIAGARVYPMLVPRDKDGLMTSDEVFGYAWFYSNMIGQAAALEYHERLRSAAGGEFVIDTLVPGARFYIRGEAGARQGLVPLKPLEPGEDRDLGEITLKERQQ